MNENLLNFLVNMGAASLIPIATALGAFLVQKIKLQALNIKGEIWEKIQVIVKTAIMSSEQLGSSGKITDKKEHAMEVAKKLLAARKMKVDDDILSELIESQVWSSINSQQSPEPEVKTPEILETKTEELTGNAG